MSTIGNNFLLVGDKFMPEVRLRQPALGKQKAQEFNETGSLRYIY